MIRLLQINLEECRTAHDLMLVTAEQNATDVILVSESNKALCDGLEGCYMDQGRRAAIIVNNKNLRVTKVRPGDNTGFRWIAFEGVRVYSCYWPPTRSKADHDRFVDFIYRLEISLRSTARPVVVAGTSTPSPRRGVSPARTGEVKR